MIYTNLIIIILASSIGALIRLALIKKDKKINNYFEAGPYGDAATYFFLIQFFRKHKCGVSDERCLISKEPVLVPSLYMKLISFFNDNILIKKSWLPNFIIYTISSLLYISLLVASDLVSSTIDLFPIFLLYFLQPDNIALDSKRIQYVVLQPRYFGLVVNSFFWFIFILYGADYKFIIVYVFLLILSLNTSIFSRQLNLFSISLVSILMGDLFLIYILTIAIVFSGLLFPTEFYKSIKPQIKYSTQYLKNYYKPRKTANRFNFLIKTIVSRPFFESYPYLVSILFSVILSYLYFYKSSIFKENEVLFQRAFYVYFSILIIFMTTGLRRLAALGECWRYFSFSTYFSTPFLVYKFFDIYVISPTYQTLIVAIIIIYYLALFLISKRNKLINKNASLISLLKKVPDDLTRAIWYGVPYRISTYPVSLGYGIKTFEYQYGNHSQEIHSQYFASYPFLKWDRQILSGNGVTHILADKELINAAKIEAGFETKNCILLCENDDFVVCRIDVI